MNNIVEYGNKFEIYGDELKIHKKLPAGTYVVRFSKMSGFFLETNHSLEVKEEKIYGCHEKKVNKVLKSFKIFDRNLGVILSGHKGIGKSLFAKILSNRCVEEGYPLIIVEDFIPGIASFLDEIEQEVVILFDEFDKTFGDFKSDGNNISPQETMLSLFDGTSIGKKLFIITCNEIKRLNDFLVNRPGRFHYHFRFDFPTVDEIKEYLTDKLEEEYHCEIPKVVLFSRKINLNYDCLRAIAFELNCGEKFEDAIKDLNIINTKDEIYSVKVTFSNGRVFTQDRLCINLFDKDKDIHIFADNENRDEVFRVIFKPKDCKFDNFTGNLFVDGSNVVCSVLEEYLDDEDIAEYKKFLKENTLVSVVITKVVENPIHYMV